MQTKNYFADIDITQGEFKQFSTRNELSMGLNAQLISFQRLALKELLLARKMPLGLLCAKVFPQYDKLKTVTPNLPMNWFDLVRDSVGRLVSGDMLQILDSDDNKPITPNTELTVNWIDVFSLDKFGDTPNIYVGKCVRFRTSLGGEKINVPSKQQFLVIERLPYNQYLLQDEKTGVYFKVTDSKIEYEFDVISEKVYSNEQERRTMLINRLKEVLIKVPLFDSADVATRCFSEPHRNLLMMITETFGVEFTTLALKQQGDIC